MKILVTGGYQREYNRTAVLLYGLEQLGIELVEYPYKKFTKSVKLELHELSLSCDIAFIPAFMYRNVAEVKKTVSIPVVFDPLISIYMTKVFDKKNVWQYSPRALKNYLKDYNAFKYSDLLFADTEGHKSYFSKTFKVADDKIHILPVGVKTEEFYPLAKTQNNIFKVGFYGGFLPLQGVGEIIEAANLLKDHDIEWDIIGDGYEFEMIKFKVTKLKLDRLNLLGLMPANQLNYAINSFDISLGIFGNTIKSDLVVPNKVFHYAACGQAIITKDSPAIREVFTDNENILLSYNSADDIANKVLLLKSDASQLTKLGQNARILMEKRYSATHIAQLFLDAINTLL